MICSYCGRRKGKRTCPALAGPLCAPCCGSHRQREIECPADCGYLPHAGRATHEAYESAGTRLRRFADEHGGWMDEARIAMLGGDWPVARWEEPLLGGWATAGYADASGQRLVQRFLRERRRDLSRDEVAALTCLRDQSWFSLFEVREVRIREGLELEDLLEGRPLFVQERLGTLHLEGGDLLLGWVLRLEDHHELSGACAALSPSRRDAVLGRLRGELEAARAAAPGASRERLMLSVIPRVHQWLRGHGGGGRERSGALAGLAAAETAAEWKPPEISWPALPEGPRQEDPGPQATSEKRHSLPPLAHELVARLVPGLREVVPSLARRMRASPSWGPSITWPQEAVAADAEVRKFLEAYAAAYHVIEGYSRRAAAEEADFLGHHIFLMGNFEAHYRKTFWVDESLAFQLSETDLDVEGELLVPPFPACAFVFTDAFSLRLVARALAQDPDHRRGSALRAATVYLTRIPAPGDASGLDVSLLADHGDGDWPYLLARDLLVRPRDRLDRVLESTFPDVERRESVFASGELKEVVRLALNAALYATTAHLDARVLVAPAKGGAAGGGPGRRQPPPFPTRDYSDEDVFYLPGKIPISQVRRLAALGGHAQGSRIFKRFMVRGHWRRAPSNWKDQRLRWIEPYWKGPDAALILERDYKMTP